MCDYIMLYYIFPSTQLQVIKITATCFDFNQSSFRRAYEPLLVMYGGGRAMWYPGRGSFLLRSAVVGDW